MNLVGKNDFTCAKLFLEDYLVSFVETNDAIQFKTSWKKCKHQNLKGARLHFLKKQIGRGKVPAVSLAQKDASRFHKKAILQLPHRND